MCLITEEYGIFQKREKLLTVAEKTRQVLHFAK